LVAYRFRIISSHNPWLLEWVIIWVNPKSKGEGGANAQLTLHLDVAIVLLAEVLGDHEAETDSIPVEAARVLNKSKEFEQIFLVLLGNANSRVLDSDLEEVKFALFDDADDDVDASAPGELECIRLKAEKHLHDALLVGVDEAAVPRLAMELILCIMRRLDRVKLLKRCV
jgi:hypothetical protein